MMEKRINPENGYVRASKYSNLTPKEIMEIKRGQEKAWRDKKKEYIKENYSSKWKEYRSGRCEICGREYVDLRGHYKSKKHITKEEKVKIFKS